MNMKRNSLPMMIYKLLWNNRESGVTLADLLKLVKATKRTLHYEIAYLRSKGVNIENRNYRYYLV